MMRRVLIVTALVVAISLGWFAWDGWFYIQRGYSLGVSISGHPAFEYHFNFPTWRAGIHVLLWVAAMVSIGAYVGEQSWASAATWFTFVAAFVVGIHDVVQYGTMGSPTSIWTLLLLVLFALLGTAAPLKQQAES